MPGRHHAHAQHRHVRAVAVLDDDPAAGRPGRRHHPDPRRLPVEPLPQGARRQPEPHAAGARARSSASATPCSRALAYAFPELRASMLGDGAPLRRQLGRPRRHRRRGRRPSTSASRCCCPLARPLPPAERRQLLPRRRIELPDSRARPASTGPATASCRRWATTCVGGKLAFLRRPQQERSSWFVEMELGAKYEILLYQARIAVRPQRRPHVRAHRAGRVRDPVLSGASRALESRGVNRRDACKLLLAAGVDRMPAFGIQTRRSHDHDDRNRSAAGNDAGDLPGARLAAAARRRRLGGRARRLGGRAAAAPRRC